jgi:hypothetical protein
MAEAQTKKKTSTAAAKAAAKEKQEKPKEDKQDAGRTIEVRGRTFLLPDEAPFGVVFAARLARKAEIEGDEEQATFALIDVAAAYVGQDRLEAFLSSMGTTDGGEALMELLDAIKEEYGEGPGESSASPSS